MEFLKNEWHTIDDLNQLQKFSVVSSAKLGVGSVSRIWSFMESPRYEIQNWDGGHLFSIGPPKVTGIKSYDYKRKYEVNAQDWGIGNRENIHDLNWSRSKNFENCQVVSNNGRVAATLLQEGRIVNLQFNPTEILHVRDKTLILALGFILVCKKQIF